jgi:hypothetical protein
MDTVGRLLLRFLLVPLGYLIAMVVGSLVFLLGSWKLGQAADEADVRDQPVFGFVFAPDNPGDAHRHVAPQCDWNTDFGGFRYPLLDIPSLQRGGLRVGRMGSARLPERLRGWQPDPARRGNHGRCRWSRLGTGLLGDRRL